MFVFGITIPLEVEKFNGRSTIGESAGGVLAKVQWTFANGESSVCEIPIGEVPATRFQSLPTSFFIEIYMTFRL